MRNKKMERGKQLVDQLVRNQFLLKEEYIELLEYYNTDLAQYVFEKAVAIRTAIYGKEVYTRGLIEFTNVCKNDCYYCGLRKSNHSVDRYRLSREDILLCCKKGYEYGFRTFVLQGGEDPYYTDDRMVEIISAIRTTYPDCAITLSIGEKSKESYEKYYKAGADRYLLRHETACKEHYRILHPEEMSLANRKQCLYNLKEIGYQVGCGFMVGSPGQTMENLADDLIFIKQLEPQMVGIGPFIPQKDTPFGDQQAGTIELTLFLLGLLRIMLPNVLLPATTALGTIHPRGRELGIQAGANVVMPNLSPIQVRKKYLLYDNKICTDEEAAECHGCLTRRMNQIGYDIVVSRGDCKIASNQL